MNYRTSEDLSQTDERERERLALFNRKAVTPCSPGLPLRLPWEHEGKDFQPQSGCVISG